MIAYDLRKGYTFDPRYPMLVSRPEKADDKIPYINGHNVRADTIDCYRRIWRQSPRDIARNMDIPLEKVDQALTWCNEHRDLVTRVDIEERRRLGIK